MINGYFRKTAVAAIAAAVVTMAAWKAPQASSIPDGARLRPVESRRPAPVPAAVAAASYAPVVERVMPAVVTIRVEKRASMVPTGQQQIPEELRRFFGDQIPQMRGQRAPRVQRGLGSGVIVSQDGYILTNNHVVEGSDTVKVELSDDRSFTAKVVGTDPATDLAVVKIEAKELPTLEFGDSDAVKVGDVALAVGNPLGVGETVTSGHHQREGTPDAAAAIRYQDFLQTDAAINHGNSGGALVNAGGQLIGINSQILTPTDGNIGLGFAIPSNMAKHVMDQLISTGTVRRAKLGITVQRITPDLAASLGLPSAKGALVSGVDEGSPAAKAGLKQGDVITSYNGKPVIGQQPAAELRGRARSPARRCTLQVLRNGRTETLQATVGELAAAKARARRAPSAERGEGQLRHDAWSPATTGLAIVELDPAASRRRAASRRVTSSRRWTAARATADRTQVGPRSHGRQTVAPARQARGRDDLPDAEVRLIPILHSA